MKKKKNFCAAKGNTKKVQRQPTKWEKVFANHLSGMDLHLKYVIIKDKTINGQRIGTDISTEDMQKAKKHMKRCSTSSAIRETQTKTRTALGWVQKTDNNKCRLQCGATGILIHCWRDCKMVKPL